MKTVSISEAESMLMQELWQHGSATADSLHKAVAERTEWQGGTVKSLLNRLLRKGAIRAEREGRRFRYHPVLSKDDYISDQSRSLLDRLFNGRIAPLVAHFNDRKALSATDLEELRQLIKELDNTEADHDD